MMLIPLAAVVVIGSGVYRRSLKIQKLQKRLNDYTREAMAGSAATSSRLA